MFNQKLDFGDEAAGLLFNWYVHEQEGCLPGWIGGTGCKNQIRLIGFAPWVRTFFRTFFTKGEQNHRDPPEPCITKRAADILLEVFKARMCEIASAGRRTMHGQKLVWAEPGGGGGRFCWGWSDDKRATNIHRTISMHLPDVEFDEDAGDQQQPACRAKNLGTVLSIGEGLYAVRKVTHHTTPTLVRYSTEIEHTTRSNWSADPGWCTLEHPQLTHGHPPPSMYGHPPPPTPAAWPPPVHDAHMQYRWPCDGVTMRAVMVVISHVLGGGGHAMGLPLP